MERGVDRKLKACRILIHLGVVLIVLGVFFPSVIPQVLGLPSELDGPRTIPTDGGVYANLEKVQIVTPTTKDPETVTYACEVRWFMDKPPIAGTDGLSLREVETTPTNITWQTILQNSPSPGNHSFTFRVVWRRFTVPADLPKRVIVDSWTEYFSGTFTITRKQYAPRRALFLTDAQVDFEIMAEKADLLVCHYFDGEKIKRVNEIRSDMLCLLHRDMRHIYDSAIEWNLTLTNDWILRDENGEFVQSVESPAAYFLDIGNSEYQEWVADWTKQYLDQYGFDGVLADRSLYTTLDDFCWDTTQKPVNPRTGLVYTDGEIKQACIELINRIRDKISPRLVICNGIFHGTRFWNRPDYIDILVGSRIDGVMSEGMFYRYDGRWISEQEWLESVDFARWMEDNFLEEESKIFLPHIDCSRNLPDGCSAQQMATYVFSSLLMSAGNSQKYVGFGNTTFQDYAQELFNIDLGFPAGNYSMIEGTHVYTRDFSNVKILVNPTFDSYTVNLGNHYGNSSGQTMYEIAVEPHTGVILQDASKTSTFLEYFSLYGEGDFELFPFCASGPQDWDWVNGYQVDENGTIYKYGDSGKNPDVYIKQSTEHVQHGMYSAEFHLGEGTEPTHGGRSKHCKLYERFQDRYPESYWNVSQPEAYYSIWYWFPSDFADKFYNWRLIAQWCTSEFGIKEPHPTLSLIFKSYGGMSQGLFLYNGDYYRSDNTDKNWYTGYTASTIPKNAWVHIVAYVKMSSAFRELDGICKVWINGILAVDEIIGCGNKDPPSRPNAKGLIWGIGNYGHKNNKGSIWIDNVQVADKYIP